jgi:hypothetical protein
MLKFGMVGLLTVALALPALAQSTMSNMAPASNNPQSGSNSVREQSTYPVDGNGSQAQVQSKLNAIRSTTPGNVGSGVSTKPSAIGTSTTVAPQ